MNEKISSEGKLMSLLAHLSIVIPNIGIIAPVIIWVTQKDKSKFVRFNAIQAIFFQLVFFVLLMLSIFIGLILMFISLPLITKNPDAAPGRGLEHLQPGSGRIFRYLIIGRIIERRIYKQPDKT